MKQVTTIFIIFFLTFNQIQAQTNSFVSHACIGTTTGGESRLYNPIAADFDGDGDLDVLVNDEGSNILLYKNNGTGSFATSINIAVSTFGSMSAGDLDGDGDVDFAHSNGFIYLNNGSGTAFTKTGKNPPTNTTPFFSNAGCIAIANFGGDSKNDIFWGIGAMGATDYNEVHINTSSGGTLSFATPSSSQKWDNTSVGPRSSVAIGDIDGDGDNDIVTGGGSWSGDVRKNNGDGTFISSQTLGGYSGRVWLADWDSDGDLDYLLADNYNGYGFRIRRNNGVGSFETSNSSNLLSAGAWVHTIGDLNGDGLIDAVLGVNGTTSKFYTNTGCLLNQQTQDMSNGSNGSLIADFTGDGKKDIFFFARDAQSCLYRNDLNTASTPALANVTATTAGARCGTGTVTLSATASNSGTLKWYNAASGGSPLQTGASYTPNISSTTNFYVDATNSNGCVSARSTVTATVNTTYSLPTTNQTISQNVSSTNFTDSECKISVTVTPSGASPVSGVVNVKTWIESGAFTYVKRHYEITPQSNANTATGTVKLYFTQAEFDAYNADNAVDLPTSPTDEVGKANVKIAKYAGTSSDGTGLPATYSGSYTTITPGASNVVWNSTYSYWEVTFSVTGFSGFLIGSESTVLSSELVDFAGKNTEGGNVLTWQTATETNSSHFDIERSSDGHSFQKIGAIKAQGKAATYQFTDNAPLSMNYYRLKEVGFDRTETLSKVVTISLNRKKRLKIYPSVTTDVLNIEGENGTTFEVINILGQVVLKGCVKSQIDVSQLVKGSYWLKTESDMTQFIKQ
ncbi:MAG: T9SS type A sorting domain-containing protein [Saprospiraceae bacterium]|nr:T9SS type A sorting domain-containing protein [Saprospiraceae bacterium]